MFIIGKNKWNELIDRIEILDAKITNIQYQLSNIRFGLADMPHSKKDVELLLNSGTDESKDPEFNRVNINYTSDDEREYELREKWQKEHKFTAEEQQEWDRINEKYKRNYEPILTQAEQDIYDIMDSKAKSEFIINKFFSDKKK